MVTAQELTPIAERIGFSMITKEVLASQGEDTSAADAAIEADLEVARLLAGLDRT